MKKRSNPVWICSVCLLGIFLMPFTLAPAQGADAPEKTKIDKRDIYLDLEGLCGAEGLPYDFVIPEDEYVKTKLDSRDIYLDMDALCGYEGLPYRFLIIPAEYVKIKQEPKDLDLDLEKMLTDDPSFVEGQEDY
ncbi:MAG: hypothetical protein RI601_03545 [Desulfurivibrionaceae bacterium]|nr:hypothetical protein [Desulfurivibrionaceae bacterium]